MTYLCGIYGYQITKKIEIEGFKIVPLTEDLGKAKLLARDEHSYNLTAILEGDELLSDNFLFNLEAVLSFIEHIDVLITSPIESTSENLFSQFNQKIAHHRKNGSGAVIGEDTVFGNSREIFIQKAMNKLQDTLFCERTKFNTLFFKCVEAFRSTSFQEVQYFLLFSGLESFAREIASDESIRGNKNASVPICELLRSHDFDVACDRPQDLKRAVSSYTHIRNALFHNSEFEIKVKINSKEEIFALRDYFLNFKLLVPLVILKIVDFDDGHINWNSWIDWQPFK
jgi:hypothetical protein